jgi:O-acetyl-ADP-ribose deacetylase (regulator of RNase III)
MIVELWDVNPAVVLAWKRILRESEDVQIGSGDILRTEVDAVVSPANSFGYMDGGIDLVYRDFFGLFIENRVQQVIREQFDGELPVGSAFAVTTGHSKITRLIVAPTMRIPRVIAETNNVYRATKAALSCALTVDPPISRLGLPGMGTGVGRMDPSVSADQMFRAFLEVMTPDWGD